MDKLQHLKNLIFNKPVQLENLTNDEVMMMIIDFLKKNGVEALFENIAAFAFIHFPERFALLGYSSFLDSKRVHDCLLHLGKHGKRLIIGDRNKGFDFSEKGLFSLRKISESSTEEKKEKSKVRIRLPQTKETEMIKWIKETAAYKKYHDGKIEDISDYELRSMLRGTNLSSSAYLRQSLDAYRAYAKVLEENEVLGFLKAVERKWPHLFERLKIRGRND